MIERNGRLPSEAHTSQPWRIHPIAPDFDLLDVWALPTPGGPDDFHRLLVMMQTHDAERSSPAVHALFAVRSALGRLLRLDGPADGLDTRVTSLRARLPKDLLDTSPPEAATRPFTLLYATHDEAALEIANRTVHGVMHLGWVSDGHGGHRGQMAVLVKPNGIWGTGYLSAIAPFRHLVVYPSMLRAIGRRWQQTSNGRITVKQIEAPEHVRDLSTLPHVDYADAFVVQTDTAPQWTAERWARAILEEAPEATRAKLRAGWTALGLKIGAESEIGSGAVSGWPVRRNTPDVVLLGAESRVGMPGQLLVMTRPHGLLFATFVHHRTPATRAVWAATEGAHVRTVPALLGDAARRAIR